MHDDDQSPDFFVKSNLEYEREKMVNVVLACNSIMMASIQMHSSGRALLQLPHEHLVDPSHGLAPGVEL